VSFLNAAERFASIDRSQVILDSARCLHSQDQYSECAACFDLCPVQAIAAGQPPTLDMDSCQSCLACLPACPVGAYRADDDVSNLLNCVSHIEGQAVEILCGLHPNPEMGEAESIGIQIQGCLAGLGSGAYLTLSALGLERIIVRADTCSACMWHSLHHEIRSQTDSANRFLAAWEKIDPVLCLDELEAAVARTTWKATNPPLSRRDLFRLVARQGQVALARAMEHGVTGSKRQPGRDRLRLLSAVSHLPDPVSTADLDGLGFATLVISEACTACGSCGRVCPTEALRFKKNEDDMTFSISFCAKNCISCDLCKHVCLPDAITLDYAAPFERVFSVKEPAIVEAGSMVRCERCKTWMAARAGMKLCQLCEYRRTHPFGSMMPKKIQKEPHP
jgi:ferredoxin